MSRTLTGPPPPPSPPSSPAGPTIVLPDHTSPNPSPPERRRRGWLIVAACALALVAAAGSIALTVRGTDADRAAALELEAAVALEQGVRPLVSDRVGELGTITSVTVKRTSDPTPAVAFLLARDDDSRPRVSLVSDPDSTHITVDGLLADGRPYEILQAEGRYISLATVGTDGQYVQIMGRAMTFEELLPLAGATQVALTTIDRLADGWTQLGSTPMPPWIDGFGTYYEIEDGRRLGITVERAVLGRAALAAFGTAEPIDLGTDGWAYRYLRPHHGVLFERGDVVVELTGSFSIDEFRMVAHSLREMRPGEHPLTDPDPYP